MSKIITSIKENVLIISIHRSEAKNAINQEMYRDLNDALRSAMTNASVRSILIKGLPEIFCAGNDMKDFVAMARGEPDKYAGGFMKSLITCYKPVVASVSGFAIGIGTTMLQFVDFLYVSPTAMFQTPFVPLGLCPEFASSIRLEQIIGMRKARAMLLSGETMAAEESVALGFSTKMVENPDEVAFDKAAELALMAPNAMQKTKELLTSQCPLFVDAIEIENKALLDLVTKSEAKEAITAFFEKRKPNFV
ncbi:enoyl-CoA hydratase-related protein [Shewanella violacea]|uniref:Enoyl-CoA hydratase/isomerase family protein n=1 Tax=Shewanella violacea (strain JCM 10179 / CIP 106290 / LMG 19151 / DSS12) TaxID=637905 RepID=D4ZDC5_SHEVD|nr:enoyl-CoA hydratase-related protein [Shewanella violacea]BAJ00047.1 enoyl-CoA hydratase/isomerase family protein [Shewanella violacea DSS12]